MTITIISPEDIVHDMPSPVCSVCGRTTLAADEAWNVEIIMSVDANGDPTRVKAWRCPTCEPRPVQSGEGRIAISM